MKECKKEKEISYSQNNSIYVEFDSDEFQS